MSADVVIIDSGGANLASLQHALRRLRASSVVSADPEVIGAARRLLLPGVGSAAAAMHRLRDAGLDTLLRSVQVPLLGICLGMQLLFEHSDEGDTPCLGLLNGRVLRLRPDAGLPVPHMGWNTVTAVRSHTLLADLPPDCHVYFVHSYAAAPSPDSVACSDYGGEFASIVAHRHVMGTQFHPERSGRAGAQVLRNFLELD